ncbi:type IV pilus twitching motility protein PilT [bacterium]|nr:type IV pilus twitching motility protein PilT [bacterium]
MTHDLTVLDTLLKAATTAGASDLHIKTFSVPVFRINGDLVKMKEFGIVKPEHVKEMLRAILTREQSEKFLKDREIDASYGLSGVGRFRVNVFQQRGSIGLVLRSIPFSIAPMEELHLPVILKKLAMMKRGLVLVTGVTGSGKSTTMASLVDYINNNRTSHVLTIEDPIEFLLRDKKAIINQREIGQDTRSFVKALRAALRQDPDVIVVGEMRDLETIEIALMAAETGHLVISTLHTLDAPETVNRIIGMFPPHQQSQIRQQLASVFAATVCQRLLVTKDKKGRVPAVEVMIGTQLVKEIILAPDRIKEVHDVIQKGHQNYGMQTFDQSIFQLYRQGLITRKEALDNATSPDDLALRMQGVSISGDGDWGMFDGSAEEEESGDTKQPSNPGFMQQNDDDDDEFDLE